MGRTAVFMDAGYMQKAFPGRLAYRTLSELLVNGREYLRTYFYHAYPYKGNPPLPEDAGKYSRAQAFFDAVRRLPSFETRLGKVEVRGQDSNGDRIFQQKQVDILFACDLVLLSTKRIIETAVLITGDSDFIPAIKIAKDEGVRVELYYGRESMPHRNLLDAVDTHRPITDAELSLSKKSN